MSAFNYRNQRTRASRTARFETLENRLLLTATRGLDDAAFDALKADWPGFDYSGIVAENVLVLDATNGIDAQALRQAIDEAKARGGNDLIVVQTGDEDATIRFESADDLFKIDDVSPLTIIAAGPSKLTIDANGKSGIFEVAKGSELSLGALVLTGGAAANGGAVYNAGTLFLDGTLVASNVALQNGGGIYNASNLTVVNSIVTDNRSGGNGGGVYSGGAYEAGAPIKETTFIACDIVGNEAGVDGNGWGGGIYFAGQDADFNIFAEMRLDASIVAQNRSSATDCDINIYNSAFYNEIELGGERYAFEIPIAALIDGDYNLTTFTYWVSSYDPNDENAVGSNCVYREATPLFVRDYDFETRTIGDYALYDSPLSQAIDKAPLAKAVYPNGRPLARDFAGNRRVQNGALDAGALEHKATQIDLATKNGAQISATESVVGGRLRLEGIEASNLSDEETVDFKLQIFASENLTFDPDFDVVVGEIDGLRLAPKATQTFDSKELATERLTPGVAYYFYWQIVADGDGFAANNRGATDVAAFFYAENDAVESAPLEFETYRTERDSAFYLAVSPRVAEQFGDGFAYWWDYGDGRFAQGATGDWVAPALPDADDASVVALKIVDEATGTVVAKGSAALEATWTAPTIACDVRESPNDSTLLLSFTLQGNANRAINEWQIAWGDGTTSTFNVLGSSLNVGHCYSPAAEMKTHPVSLTVVEAGSQARKTTYRLFDFKVAGTATSASVPEEAAENLTVAVGNWERPEKRSNEETRNDSAFCLKERRLNRATDAGASFTLTNKRATVGEATQGKDGAPRNEATTFRSVRELGLATERGVLAPLTDDAFREFWRRRQDKEALFDGDDALEREFEFETLDVWH